jgi:glutamyl-tRNA synthetase
VHDLLHGDITAEADDVVLQRNDGTPAYNLAVVVDDGFSGVDQVVRGDDLLPTAATQAFLAELLGYPPPLYAHVPLAVNAEGRRLAKRDGAVTLPDLAALGMEPSSVLGLIAVSLDLASPGEGVTPEILLQRFDPERLPRKPWVVMGLRSGT